MGNTTVEDYIYSGFGLITQLQYFIIMDVICIVSLVIAITGVISNIINIKVFVAMGIDNGVTVSFLALAVFDLAFLISSIIYFTALAFKFYELKFTTKFCIDPYAIFVFCFSVTNIIGITNVLTTTFIAVVRCLSVAKPLQFKNAITKDTATFFIIVIAAFSVTIYIPVLANMGMTMKFDELSKTSRPSLWLSPNRELAKKIVWMSTDMFLPVATQLLILVCVVIMARCLLAASKFRQSSGGANVQDGKHESRKTKKINVNDSNNSNDKLSGKDLRVVQQVVLISVVSILCNVPKILISFSTIVEPEFTLSRRFANIYLCVNSYRKQLEVVNAAVNLIIYYKYNKKFRSVLCM